MGFTKKSKRGVTQKKQYMGKIAWKEGAWTVSRVRGDRGLGKIKGVVFFLGGGAVLVAQFTLWLGKKW